MSLNGDGMDGQDGQDGVHGVVVLENNHGGHGVSATPAEHGHDGHRVFCKLSTTDDGSVHFYAMAHDQLLLDETFPMNQVPVLRWSARGGQGGHGAKGGDGCAGLPGLNGDDATKTQAGTNGLRGGNGGDGGFGSHGANGGNGGTVRILVDERDLYLLMTVDPCEFTPALLRGGKPGRMGQHGLGGVGGPGGKGGRALLYEEAIDPTTAHDLNNQTTSKSSRNLGGGGGNKKNQANAPQLVHIKIPGGKDGQEGEPGYTPDEVLMDGVEGSTGTFHIQVVGHEEAEPYEGRYDLELVDWEIQGKSPMASGECEFGDLLGVHSVVVRNTGRMPLPSSQIVRLLIRDERDPNVNPLLGDACLPEGTVLAAGETCVAQGELPFFAGYPNEVDDPDDFEPLRHTTHFCLQAFQMGPNNGKDKLTSDYSREYRSFHSPNKAIPITYRYPVENKSGLFGVSSLYPTEETMVSLQLDNVGLESLGNGDGHPQRSLGVRFFVNKNYQDVHPSELLFRSIVNDNDDNGACNQQEVDLSGSGKLLDVPTILPGTSHWFRAAVSFREHVPFYSRTALQVDVLIETLPLPEGVEIVNDDELAEERRRSNLPQMSVIQRRQLRLVCEPKYQPNPSSRVVLVTSFATTQAQFESWTKTVLQERWDVPYEVYSLSRYGTLDPFFVLDDAKTTLREAFANKLIILLTEPFFPDPMDDGKKAVHPHQFLLNGCMEQSSGFDPCTKWLVVGGNAQLNRDLLSAHLSIDDPEEGDDFVDVATYQKHVLQRVQGQSAKGRGDDDLPLRRDTIPVPRDGKRAAESLRDWLMQNDPLCQYTIEYTDSDKSKKKKKGNNMLRNAKSSSSSSSSSLTVRRGYCRSQNSVVVVLGRYTMEPKSIKSEAMILSVAEALSLDMRVTLFCEAIRKPLPDATLTALKYAAVSELIREQIVFLDCRMKMNEDLELSFPTIGSFLDSVDVLSLVRDAKRNPTLRKRACRHFSELLARFELVANSKDLRPRFAVMGRGKKKTTKEAMTGIVERLRVQWKPVIDPDLVDRRKKALKEEIKKFLMEDTGKKKLNVRADQRWMQGLNYVHSTENEVTFGIANSSKRLLELDVDDEKDNYKISAPSVRVYSSKSMRQLTKGIRNGINDATAMSGGVQSKRTSTIVSDLFPSQP